MNIALDILILGSATAAGFTTGWMIRPGKPSTPEQGGGGQWREKALYFKEQVSAALDENSSIRNQAAMARSEAATFKLEAAQSKRDLEYSRADSARAHQALSQLQQLAASMASDIGQHNSRVNEINEKLQQDKDPSSVVDAVATLLQVNAQMQKQLNSAEARLKDQAQELQAHIAEARTDALTGLCNRRAFDRHMAELEEQFQSDGRTSCVMMIDVDFFKKFNDTYGHQAGDEVLRGVARVLKENLESNAIVCRYGGEEFAAIFPGCDLEAARPAAEQARAMIAESTFDFEGTQLRVTASGGIAQFVTSETTEELVKRADSALYVCKEAGRNCGHYHDGTTIVPMTERLLASQEVEETLELPGISTREVLVEDLDRRLAEWRRGGPELSMIMVEIDRFDRLLQTFGESARETILKATAQFLKAMMRDMDHVAWWDECRFALVLPSAKRNDASGVAERLRSSIESFKLQTSKGLLQFTISVGVTELSKGDSTQSLLERVNVLVDEALAHGGNRSLIAKTEMSESMN